MKAIAQPLFTLGIIISLLVILCSYSNPTTAEQTGDKSSSLPGVFEEGKIVTLILDESSALESKTSTRTLTNARIVEIGKRFFITGTAYVTDHDVYENSKYMEGVFVGIAWDSVSEFREHTKEQFDNYLEEWKRRSEQ